MKKAALLSCIALGFAACWGSPAKAVLTFDDNTTSNILFGSGVGNGGFTVDRNNGVEIALRGKLRFDATNQPLDVFNSNGAGSYTFAAGSPTLALPHPSWVDATTPIWNFDWSINTNWDNSAPGRTVGNLTYRLDMDFDPAATGIQPGTTLSFNLVAGSPAMPFWDHAFGTNTSPAPGLIAGDKITYGGYLSTYNVAQNSVNYEFFDAPATAFTFDPNIAGEYTVAITAFSGATALASSQINVVVSAVPEASALWFVGISGALCLLRARRQRLVEAGRA